MSKFKKIVLLGFSTNDLGKSEWGRIDGLCDQKVLTANENPDLSSLLGTADCLIVRLGATVDRSMIDKASELKYIGMFGTGYGRIDTGYAAKKGIVVCNIAGYSREGVAEFVFGMILEQIREMDRAKQQAGSGNYSEATFRGSEIKGKKFGVVGLGRNGSRIAEIACFGFQAEVKYWSKHRKVDFEKNGIQYSDLDQLLMGSDILSINIASVPGTQHFFDRQKIDSIKPGCLVISTVQNEVFDLEALKQRLQRNDITVILDHPDELTAEQAKDLARYSNCIFYPPIGYVTKEAASAKISMFVDNLENFLQGRPTYQVN